MFLKTKIPLFSLTSTLTEICISRLIPSQPAVEPTLYYISYIGERLPLISFMFKTRKKARDVFVDDVRGTTLFYGFEHSQSVKVPKELQ